MTTFSLGPFSLEAENIKELKSIIGNLSIDYLKNKIKNIFLTRDIFKSISPILENKILLTLLMEMGQYTLRTRRIYIAGLTPNELIILLQAIYNILKNHTQIEMITIDQFQFVEGEVNTQTHTLPGQSFKKDIVLDKKIIPNEKLSNYVTPTLFNAIAQAGGINLHSDLNQSKLSEKIQFLRRWPEKQILI